MRIEELSIRICSKCFLLISVLVMAVSIASASMIDGSGITVTVSDLNGNDTAFNTDYVTDGSGITNNYGVLGTEWFTNDGETRDDTWISFDLGAGYVLDSILPATAVRHVRFEVDSAFDGNATGYVGLNEVQFFTSTTAPALGSVIYMK